MKKKQKNMIRQEQAFERMCIRVLRFWNYEVMKEIDIVIDKTSELL